MTPERQGAALVRDVVGRAGDPVDPLTSIDALEQVTPADVELILHPRGTSDGSRVVARGIAASPGVARGVAVLDPGRALDLADQGRPFILVRDSTAPGDELVLAHAAGVVTSSGGLASHAAILARGRGLPAVCGTESLLIGEHSFTAPDGTVVHEGDPISIDGTTGDVAVGGDPLGDVGGAKEIGVAGSADLPDELGVLLGWADDVRAGILGVWANADTADDARRARSLGAEGIGLCRTEHLFHDADRAAVLQRMLHPERTVDAAEAEVEVCDLLRGDLVELLEVMDGLPVTVRLLDLSELEKRSMLGGRGVRSAVVHPELYRAQVRAAERRRRHPTGGRWRPLVRILVPLVVAATEVVLVRELVTSTLRETPGIPDIPVGAMVETPRAALQGAELAVAGASCRSAATTSPS